MNALADTEKIKLRKRLLVLREELNQRIGKIQVDLCKRLNTDSAERAVELENADVLTELDREACVQLNEIDAALLKFQAGTYGYCSQCKKEISAERLDAYPAAAICFSCATNKTN